MAKQPISKPSVRDAQQTADALLSQHGNRLLLIEALILTVLMCSMYVMIDGLFYVLAQMLPQEIAPEILTGAKVLVQLLLSLLVILPLLVGLLRMAFLMEQGQETVLADLFHSFSSAKAYGRALGLSFGFVWRACLVSLAVCATYLLADYLPLPLIAIVGAALLIVAEAFVGLLLLSRLFYTLAFSMQEPTLRLSQCRKRSRQLTKRFRLSGWGFFLHYLPQILLGLLTVGILLLAHTIPRMLLSYFCFCLQGN
jgi:hypothetical protein